MTGRVLGLDFFVGTPEVAARCIIEQARSGRGGYACFTGVHGTVLARHDASLRDALRGAWRNFPDGAPIAWLARRTGCPEARRIPGPDLMPLVIERGVGAGLRHFVFGSTDPVLRRCVDNLAMRAPRAKVVGTLSPPFREHAVREDEAILERIRRTRPDVVWVGLGTPKQDLWLRANAALLRPALIVSVGAALDFLAGTQERAPEWMQHSGLEWLYRAATEKRLRQRYLRINSEFVALAVGVLAADRATGILGRAQHG